MELAIMNGTYRDNSKKAQSVNGYSVTSKGGQITPTSVAMVPNREFSLSGTPRCVPHAFRFSYCSHD